MLSVREEYFGIGAGFVSAIAFVPYVRSILIGRTRPSFSSWWAWTILTGATLISSWQAGANGAVLILPAWLCLTQACVAVLAIKHGDRVWDGWNVACVFGAGMGLLLWAATGQPLIALILSIVADIFATIPTIRHAWSKPHEENRAAWTIGWVSGILLLFAVREWSIASAGWAVYFACCMSVILALVWRPTVMGYGKENL